MNFTELKTHCSEDAMAMETEGYDSWAPKDDTIILMKADRDEKWYRVTYLQLCNPVTCWQGKPTDPLVLISQLEGLPEDPNNTVVLDNMEVRVFKELV